MHVFKAVMDLFDCPCGLHVFVVNINVSQRNLTVHKLLVYDYVAPVH